MEVTWTDILNTFKYIKLHKSHKTVLPKICDSFCFVSCFLQSMTLISILTCVQYKCSIRSKLMQRQSQAGRTGGTGENVDWAVMLSYIADTCNLISHCNVCPFLYFILSGRIKIKKLSKQTSEFNILIVKTGIRVSDGERESAPRAEREKWWGKLYCHHTDHDTVLGVTVEHFAHG